MTFHAHLHLTLSVPLLHHSTEIISVYTKSRYKTAKEDKKGRKNAGSKGFPERKKNIECNMFLVTNCIWDFIQQWNIHFVVYFANVFFLLMFISKSVFFFSLLEKVIRDFDAPFFFVDVVLSFFQCVFV